MVVLENSQDVHNLVVCTLCSCYPWPILGLPPVWYKSAPYRSRSVIDPRGVLRELGLVPVFAEPWQAQAFALAVRLSAQGYFTWKKWTAVLGDELKSAADRGHPDDVPTTTNTWLVALERLETAKGLSNPNEMLARKDAWADAYRHTPHGKINKTRAANSGGVVAEGCLLGA